MSQVICITGASRGLGLRLTESALNRGDQVIAVSRSMSPALATLRERHGGNCTWVQLDLAARDDRAESVRALLPLSLDVNAIILNAAIAFDGLATGLPEVEIRKMFEVNVFSGMEIGRQFIRNRLAKRARGHILTISSIAAHEGFTGLSAYAASKAALEAWTRTVAREWRRKGILANSIAAGFMETDMTSGLSTEQRQRIFRRSDSNGPTSMEAICQKVNWLLTEANESLSGLTYRIE